MLAPRGRKNGLKDVSHSSPYLHRLAHGLTTIMCTEHASWWNKWAFRSPFQPLKLESNPPGLDRVTGRLAAAFRFPELKLSLSPFWQGKWVLTRWGQQRLEPSVITPLGFAQQGGPSGTERVVLPAASSAPVYQRFLPRTVRRAGRERMAAWMAWHSYTASSCSSARRIFR